MLKVSSDGPLPLDRLEIEIRSNDKVLLQNEFRVPEEAPLPTTVAIVSNGDETARVQIAVIGWDGDVPLDRRDAIVTQIPVHRVATLSVVLSARCTSKVTVDSGGSAMSTCGEGQTCDGNGDCGSTEVVASELPDFDAANTGGGGSSGSGPSGGSGATGGTVGGGTVGGGAGSGGQENVCTKACDTPPPNDCESAGQFRAYDKIGSCVSGSCEYASQLIACTCQAHACTTDPCLTVSCETPPAARCMSGTLTTYTNKGTCAEGSCSYASTDVACQAKTPQCLVAAAKCVECSSDADCGGGVKCDKASNSCVIPPSCQGLGAICGQKGNAGCCASTVVPGGTFNRFNGASYPGTVSDFRLDTYEITVGRFRKFLEVYSPNMIPQGAGKNPSNPDDPGWNTNWNASLPSSRDVLDAAFVSSACGNRPAWWTPQSSSPQADSLPVSCLTGLEAQAFCIWDGGRLPTEAEWNYAATGGAEQRKYPWGSAALDCTLTRYRQDLCGGAESDGPIRVGSHSPQGDGKFGQADLAGNAWEYVQDFYVDPAPAVCTDCATLTAAGSGHTYLGGSWYGNTMFLLNASRRTFGISDGRNNLAGARCARTP